MHNEGLLSELFIHHNQFFNIAKSLNFKSFHSLIATITTFLVLS